MLGLTGVMVRHQRSSTSLRTRTGPVPGYSYTRGEEVAISPQDAGFPSATKVVSLEEFHSQSRSRLVLSLLVSSLDELNDGVIQLAQELQAKSHAHVVLIECSLAGGSLLMHLYAPDAKGWTGNDSVSTITWTS